MKNKNILIIVLLFTIIILGFITLKNWSYSITEIEADNYEEKLHPNNENISDLEIESYIPSQDAECFSISTNEVFTKGKTFGIKIIEKPQFGVSEFGTWYSYENSPSGLEYFPFYSGNNILTQLKIYSHWKYYNALRIKEIIRQLMEKKGFILKQSQMINGADIIIKETEKSFIVGKINKKYSDERQPTHGIYFASYSKKHY